MVEMDKLKNDIKSGQFEPVYLLFGEERYLVHSFAAQLRQAIVGDDSMNDAYFEGKEVSLEEVSDLAQTMPFFADRRLIRLSDTGLFKRTEEAWISLIEAVPEGCHLLFTEQEADKRSRMYRAVSTKGYCCEFRRRTEQELKRWISGGLGAQGYRIRRDALDLFFQRTGDDMINIRSEMEKLAAYCMGREEILLSDVEEVTAAKLVNRVFDMVQAVSDGKKAKALSLYYDLAALKEKGSRILYLIARQMNQLLCVREMLSSGARQDEIAARLKLSPYIAGKLMQQARQFSPEQLKEFVRLCVSLEEAFKSGNLSEQIAVEMLLSAIASRRLSAFRETR